MIVTEMDIRTKMTIGVIEMEQMDIRMIQQDGARHQMLRDVIWNSCYRWRRYSNLDNYRIFTIYPKQKWNKQYDSRYELSNATKFSNDPAASRTINKTTP